MRNRFDRQLLELNNELIQMGSLIEQAIEMGISALVKQDVEKAEQAIKFFWIFIGNRYITNAQIRKLCKKAILFHIQSNSHHINDRVTTFFTQLRQNLL